MSALVCSLSGAPLVHGVFSIKTGHLFQKSTILRYIEIEGKCPHTGSPLSVNDIKEIQGNNTLILPNQQSTAALAQKLSLEYDALILQTHYLKKSVRETRQELATSLYRQDASIRVIAKLKTERDQARQQVAALMKQLRNLQNK